MDRRVTLRVRWIRVLFPCLALLAGMTGAAGAQGLPSGWSSSDVGGVGAGGSATASGNWFDLYGAGADIWGTADGFRYAYQSLTGDGEIVAQVASVDYVHGWSKGGVMMRESLSAGSPHAYVLVSAGNGTAFQRRTASGSSSTHTAASGGQFVRLVRSGDTFTAYSSWDGSGWMQIGSQTIAMSSTIYVGLAVTSHTYGVLTHAAFSGVAVSSSGSGGGSSGLPSGWSAQDVGGVGAQGWTQGSGGDFNVYGSGADIWDTSDEFHFASRTLTGDGSIVARVLHVDYRDPWSKAGVMMRDSLSGGSSHAFMLVSAGKGVAFQRRTSTGSSSEHSSLGWGSAPFYVKLTRSGSNFRGYASEDGYNWSLVGSATISMGSTIQVGLAVTSHADGSVAGATFSETAVEAGGDTGEPEPAQPPGGSSSLRVLHWNVHHLIGTDGVFDVNRVAWWIAWMQPDIVSLNEIDDPWQADLIERAVEAASGHAWEATYSGWGNLILSRLTIHAASVCEFNPGDGRLAAHASVVVNGRAINLWSAHLASYSSGTREYEVYNLQSCAWGWPEARVVAGDFNMGQGSSEYNAMTAHYTDGWLAAKSLGTAANYSGNCDGCTRNGRIDFIFSSREAWFLSVVSAEVVDTQDWNGYMPSDHKPLIVTYTVH